MAPPSEGRPSIEKRQADPSYTNRNAYRQQPLDPGPNTQPSGNGDDNSIAPRPRNAGASGEEQLSNGNISDNSRPARPGRDKDRGATQDLPIRDRSRTNGSSGAKRICGKCGEPLLGQFVRAMGGMYHLECFMCRVSPSRSPHGDASDPCGLGLWANRGIQVLPS